MTMCVFGCGWLWETCLANKKFSSNFEFPELKLLSVRISSIILFAPLYTPQSSLRAKYLLSRGRYRTDSRLISHCWTESNSISDFHFFSFFFVVSFFFFFIAFWLGRHPLKVPLQSSPYNCRPLIWIEPEVENQFTTPLLAEMISQRGVTHKIIGYFDFRAPANWLFAISISPLLPPSPIRKRPTHQQYLLNNSSSPSSHLNKIVSIPLTWQLSGATLIGLHCGTW